MALGLVELMNQNPLIHVTSTVVLTGIFYGAYLQMRKSFSRRLSVIPDHKKGTIQAVVITGCDSGLGYSLALYCSDLGFKVVATVLEPDGPAAERLRELGCLVYKVDYTCQNDVKQFANEIDALIRDSRDDWEIRALVNNAAVMMFGEFEWLLPKHVETHFEVNVLGPMKLTKELLPILRRDKSRLINVVSHCALEALPGLSVYSGTKSAMLGWNNALRVELGKYGVKVVAFVPGSFIMESGLMRSQIKQFSEMHRSMKPEVQSFYNTGGYFDRYTDYLSAISKIPDNKPRPLENPKVYQVFDSALLDEKPNAIYKCEPMRYQMYHTLFKYLPTFMRDKLVERFMQMPAWNPSIRQVKALLTRKI
ncbi:estradiol 17-beta-dehydrogenase 2 isoform X1 [Trichogramma pretiosum]|uniref:estradiol 17-beta-dehydrogenase 2 isoform X1 n=1 Tax=Trichogramma pretiosum TaxID=7493 RepID=UPI0006C9A48D|nr:estradiol 17-beta-dehydrogenase 2 isoform X1 [Trichogramma pretiosum]